MRIIPALAALTLAAAPLPAAACSVAAGYRVPTNLELAGAADLILLAAVEDGADAPQSEDAMTMRIRPLAAVKGTMPTGPIHLAGTMIADPAQTLLSDPYDLAQAHPQAMAGACNRYAFPRGGTLLFFLVQRDGEWWSAGGPFSRWAEDVPGLDAPWVRAARLYAEVAALPKAEQAAALTAHRDTLRARRDDPVAQLLADDIDRQIAGPNRPLRAELPPAQP